MKIDITCKLTNLQILILKEVGYDGYVFVSVVTMVAGDSEAQYCTCVITDLRNTTLKKHDKMMQYLVVVE